MATHALREVPGAVTELLTSKQYGSPKARHVIEERRGRRLKTRAQMNEWREPQIVKPVHMETKFAVKKVGLHTPPSYENHLPLKGWHRHVILRGEVIGPQDRVVCHWPPFDAQSEDPTRRKLLRSEAEVKEWLACCNAQLYLDRFCFDASECLAEWPSEGDGLVLLKNKGLPKCLGQLPPQRSGPHMNDRAKAEEQEIFIANALGFPIDRYFEYVDELTFRWTHHDFLKTLRHSVRDDIARQCKEEKEKRQNVDAVFKKEKNRCFRHALHARHGRAVDDEDQGETSLAVEASFMNIDGMNLLYHCAACHAKSELFELTPHLAEVTGDVYQFPLFEQDYCRHLARVARAFRAKARQHCSHLVGDTARAPARICLDKLGLTEDIATELLKRVARPLAARLFPNSGGHSLDHHVAFFDTRAETVRHQEPMDCPVFGENRNEEIFHHKLEDEAEVVLDICLDARDVEGFLPSRCIHGTDEEPVEPPVEISHHQVGTALLYDGTVRHSRVVDGPERLHLVIWCRSMPFRDLNSYEGGEDFRDYGPLAHEYGEAGVPGPGYGHNEAEEEGGVVFDGEERIYVEREKPIRVERPDEGARLVPVRGYDAVGPLPYDPDAPPPQYRRDFFDEGHSREDLFLPTPRERANFKEFWRDEIERVQRMAVAGTLKPTDDVLGALLERADEAGGVEGVQYKMHSVQRPEVRNKEPPKVRFDQEDDFDNRFGEGLISSNNTCELDSSMEAVPERLDLGADDACVVVDVALYEPRLFNALSVGREDSGVVDNGLVARGDDARDRRLEIHHATRPLDHGERAPGQRKAVDLGKIYERLVLRQAELRDRRRRDAEPNHHVAGPHRRPDLVIGPKHRGRRGIGRHLP